MEAYLARARKAALGQKVTGLEWREVERDGKPTTTAFQVVLENGQVLVLFGSIAYGIGKHIPGGQG